MREIVRVTAQTLLFAFAACAFAEVPSTTPIAPQLTEQSGDTANAETANASVQTQLPKISVQASAIDEYVVPAASTGTKTDTPIMQTPLNIQVVSQQVLQDQQALSFVQALRNVSGVTLNGNSVFLRGYETYTFATDGFRLENPSGYSNGLGTRPFANVESVEVLKGAAAILYGRLEPGGLVNVVTKQPEAAPALTLQQQVGSWDLYRTSVDATGPVLDDTALLYRVNASYQYNHAYRDLLKDKDLFIAPVLRWKLDEQTSATLSSEFHRSTRAQDITIVPRFNGETLKFNRRLNFFEPNPSQEEIGLYRLEVEHDFDAYWKLKLRTSANLDHLKLRDGAYPGATVDEEGGPVLQRPGASGVLHLNSYVAGFDLTGHFDTGPLKHRLLFGAEWEKYDVRFSLKGLTASNISLLDPVHPGTPIERDGSGDFDAHNEIYNRGVYLQDQIELPYHVHLLAGARYQDLRETFPYSQAGSETIPLQPVIDDAHVTPRYAVLWQPEPWVSLYTLYVEGYGVNGGLSYPDGSAVPPTSAKQLEAGAKFELFDGRLRMSLDYFDLRKTNIATPHPDPALAAQGFSVVTGEVRTRGPELDIQGEILPGWNAIVTYAHTDAHVTKSHNGDVGDRFYSVPRQTASVWSTYEIRAGALDGLKFGGGVTAQSNLLGGFSRDTRVKIDGYALVSLMASYRFRFGDTVLKAQLNIENLTNKTYYSNGLNYDPYVTAPSGYGWNYRNFGEPRRVIFALSADL